MDFSNAKKLFFNSSKFAYFDTSARPLTFKNGIP